MANDYRLIHAPVIHDNPPGWRWEFGIPAEYDNLWILLEGNIRFCCAEREMVLDRPAYIYLPRGCNGVIEECGNAKVRNLALHWQGAFAMAAHVQQAWWQTWGQPVRQPELLAGMAEVAIRNWNRHSTLQESYACLLCHALLGMFLNDCSSPMPNTRHEPLERCAESIRLTPEKDWVVDAMARESGLSRSQFTRLFRVANGESPRSYISRCRLEKAQRLLNETRMPVSEIAEQLGYHDVYFFSRHFCKHKGLPPSAYRKAGNLQG